MRPAVALARAWQLVQVVFMCGQTVAAKLGPGAVVVVVVVVVLLVVVDEVVDDVVDDVVVDDVVVDVVGAAVVVVDVVAGDVVVGALGPVGERSHEMETTTAAAASASSTRGLSIDSNRRSNEDVTSGPLVYLCASTGPAAGCR